MPDRRQHRGPHPEDDRLFAASQLPILRQAMKDLSWLLGRGYSGNSALKLVGDRYSLQLRQRQAIMRCACAQDAAESRLQRRCEPNEMVGRFMMIDGYNVLTTVEAALAGGVLLLGRDGCLRDLASMHGSFRKVEETRPAVHTLGAAIAVLGVKSCDWVLDSPVSNSGRLKTLLLQIAVANQWNWQVHVIANPDKLLLETDQTVATADSAVLDRCGRWFNLARWVVSTRLPHAQITDLSDAVEASGCA